MEKAAPELLRGMSRADLIDLAWNWYANARLDQIAPEGDWSTWLLLAGRGFGKSRTGAEWVRSKAMAGIGPIGLIAPTAADARDVIVEGPAGILAISPPDERPLYEPSKRRLTWPNGVTASLFSADEPDRLRGPQHAICWLDELAAYSNPQAVWDMMSFGLRLGSNPQALITTTPRPIPLLRKLIDDSKTVLTRGSTRDNTNNLAPSFVDQIEARYAGTRLGRQELEGEILEDTPGALWTRAVLDDAFSDEPVPHLVRVVVAVDPSGSDGETGDSQGIVVCGVSRDNVGYVLADVSTRASPNVWARLVVEAFNRYGADRVVAERNFGGAMVEAVLRAAAPNLPITLVTASRGKAVRAEPVAALYEQRRVKHIGSVSELEDQMVMMTASGFTGQGSPDRVDALVWAFTDLMVGPQLSGWVLLEQARRDIDNAAKPSEPARPQYAPGSVEWLAENGLG